MLRKEDGYVGPREEGDEGVGMGRDDHGSSEEFVGSPGDVRVGVREGERRVRWSAGGSVNLDRASSSVKGRLAWERPTKIIARKNSSLLILDCWLETRSVIWLADVSSTPVGGKSRGYPHAPFRCLLL